MLNVKFPEQHQRSGTNITTFTFHTQLWLPEEHDQEQEVAEQPDDDEERVEDEDDDEEPGVLAEQGPEVGRAEVHRGVAVQAGQELHQWLDEGGVNPAYRLSGVLVVPTAVVQLQYKSHTRLFLYLFYCLRPPV